MNDPINLRGNKYTAPTLAPWWFSPASDMPAGGDYTRKRGTKYARRQARKDRVRKAHWTGQMARTYPRG